jgi:hypothetical protein
VLSLRYEHTSADRLPFRVLDATTWPFSFDRCGMAIAMESRRRCTGTQFFALQIAETVMQASTQGLLVSALILSLSGGANGQGAGGGAGGGGTGGGGGTAGGNGAGQGGTGMETPNARLSVRSVRF